MLQLACSTVDWQTRESRKTSRKGSHRGFCVIFQEAVSQIVIWHSAPHTLLSLTLTRQICARQMWTRCEVFGDPPPPTPTLQHQPGKGRSLDYLGGVSSAFSRQLKLSHSTFAQVSTKGGDAPEVWGQPRWLQSRAMELERLIFRLLCGLLTSGFVAAGPGRATVYLIDPVREQLIALKQWEMPSSLPPSFFPLPLSVFSHFPPLSFCSSASLPFSPYFSPCSLPCPPSPSLSPSALLRVGGSMLYLIGVSLYRRRVALTDSESGSAHLPHVPTRTTCFFLPILVLRGFTFFWQHDGEQEER